MKKLIIFLLLLTSCAVSSTKETFVPNSVSTNENFNSIQKTENINLPKENTKFVVTIPKETWEPIFFEGINERTKSSKLSNLRLKALPKDDLEVRVWSGFGITLLEGFVLKRISGEWSAVDLGWDVSENQKGKKDIKQLDKKLTEPKSGWNETWQKLVNNGLLTLPDAKGINCNSDATDGISYVIEYNLRNSYRTYMYDNPNPSTCNEAKQMIQIIKIMQEEFYYNDIKTES